MALFSCLILLILVFHTGYSVHQELFSRLDKGEISAIAYRLQDEKQQRLVMKNDVDVMMAKLGKLELIVEEIQQSKGSSAAKIECPRDWKRHENSCYYFGQESVSWLDAAVTCKNLGGHLAVIETPQENEFVSQEAYASPGQHWIDGTDALKEGQWVWVSKMENIGFTAWKDGQPDNGNSEEHCLATNFATVGKWNDGNCILKQKYICETEIQS